MADSTGSDAPIEEPAGDGDDSTPPRPGRAVQVAVAAMVIAALAILAVTTPSPSPDFGSPSPTGGVAGASSTRIDVVATPSASRLPGRSATSPPVSPSPTPEILAPLSGLYGSGIAADSKANLPVGPWGQVSHRFVAGTTSELVGVRFSQRGGPDGYSGGSGGTMRISIREDEGGLPSGSVLAELFFEPGNPSGDWTTFNRHDFPAPAALTEGSVYHVVYENVDPAPLDNFISVNDLFVFDEDSLSRPPGTGPEFAVIDQEEGAWDVQANYTPVLDVVYADGTRDGQSYIEALVDYAGFAVGPSLQARETFVVSGADRLVRSISIRARRTYGESPLVIRLESVDGTELETVTIPAEAVRVGVPGDFDDDLSENWVHATFSRMHTLAAGSGYNLVLSTADDTEYSTIPLREGTVEGLESYRFTDGVAQQTFDGGAVWVDLFDLAPADLQFYFE